MRALARREVWSDTVNIYIVTDDFRPQAAILGEDGSVLFTEYREGAEPPVFLRLNSKLATVLADGLHDLASTLPATEDALRDAREVRDRLLALVERA